MAGARERQARRSLKVLGTERLVNFLRTAGAESEPVAVRLANEELDEGRSIETMLFTGEVHGFSLVVKPITADRFTIGFGCTAGPNAGDGGEWEVSFDENDHVAELKGGVLWIA